MLDEPSVTCAMVDSHVHIFSRELPFDEHAWTRPDYEFTLQQLLATLDEHGVPFAVIAAASLFGTFNDYTVAAVRLHRRLRGTAIVAPDIPLSELRALRDSGIVGIRLMWARKGPIPDLTTTEYRRLLYRLRDLGMHVDLAAQGENMGILLKGLADAGVTTVINHFGLPGPDTGAEAPSFLATLHSAERANVWVKLSAGFRWGPTQYTAGLAARLLQAYGPDRLFWGSDCPFVGKESLRDYATVLRELTQWVPKVDDRLRMAKASLAFYFT